MSQYGYCRISTGKQNIERQVRNIQSAFPGACIVREVYTGTKFQGRKELDRLLSKLKRGDSVIFDSVSRMSRNAEEGCQMYEQLFSAGVNLIFLKEPHINTSVYQEAIDRQLDTKLETGNEATDRLLKTVIKALNEYAVDLAKQQVRLAFSQAEKEVEDLHQRTREGIETARIKGKQIGQIKGITYETRKAKAAKRVILRHNKSFGGSLSDEETMRQAGISKKSFYKYKRELREEIG